MTLAEEFLRLREGTLVSADYYAKRLYENYLELHKKIQDNSDNFKAFKSTLQNKRPITIEESETLYFEVFLPEAKRQDPSLARDIEAYIRSDCRTPQDAKQLYDEFIQWLEKTEAAKLEKENLPIKDLEIRPHFKCVAFDQTEDWCDDIKRKIGKYGRQYVAISKMLKGIDPKIAERIINFLFPVEKGGGKIYTAHLFNANSVTYCCEIRPSYELTFVEYIVDFAWDTELDTELRESIEEEINEASTDEGISYVYPDDWKLQATLDDFTQETDESELEKTVAEAYEDRLEYLRCNGGCWPYLFLNQK